MCNDCFKQYNPRFAVVDLVTAATFRSMLRPAEWDFDSDLFEEREAFTFAWQIKTSLDEIWICVGHGAAYVAHDISDEYPIGDPVRSGGVPVD